MDPVVKTIIDLLSALIAAFGRPVLDAALGHHGYVPRRVEEIRPASGHSHAADEIERLRNETPVSEPDGSARGKAELGRLLRDAISAADRRYGKPSW